VARLVEAREFFGQLFHWVSVRGTRGDALGRNSGEAPSGILSSPSRTVRRLDCSRGHGAELAGKALCRESEALSIGSDLLVQTAQ
jgi:hypothetical protein